MGPAVSKPWGLKEIAERQATADQERAFGRVSLWRCTRTRETRKPAETARVPSAEREPQASDKKAVTPAQLAEQTEIDDLRWLMSDVRGRRWMWRQLERFGVYQSTFTGEPLTGAFKEGQRSRGLELVAAITQHCPHRFFEMHRENLKHERRTESKAS